MALAQQPSHSILSTTSPFVGREECLHQLLEQFQSISTHNQISFITLIGAPGSGKTRLAQEFIHHIRNRFGKTLVLRADGIGSTGHEYETMARLLSQRFGIPQVQGITRAEARQKITTIVAQRVPENKGREEMTHLLARLLQCPFDESPHIEALQRQPGLLEMRTFIAVKRLLQEDTALAPLLLFIDSADQCDQESINLLHFLAEGLKQKPVMILAAARPPIYRRFAKWGDGDFTTTRIDLQPLTADESEALVSSLIAAHEARSKLVHIVRDRLEGSPRAICELAQLHHEADAAGQPLSMRERLVSLPNSHEEIVKARIDLLSPTQQELLKMASVVGEEFWFDAILALYRTAYHHETVEGPTVDEIATSSDETEKLIQTTLKGLIDKGFIAKSSSSRLWGEREYLFRYPPIWDLVYESIPSETRKRYHRTVAQWLELRTDGREGPAQEQVGKHLLDAEDFSASATRFRRAAEEARRHYFNHKAIRLYERALNYVAESDIASRIQLYHDVGNVYQHIGNFDRALDAFENMVRLSWLICSRSKAAVGFNKMGRVWRHKGDLKGALKSLNLGLNLFRQIGDARGVATSLDDIGQIHWQLGDNDEALSHIGEALEMRRRLHDDASVALSLTNIGNIERARGLFEQAEACFREAMSLRQKVGDRYGYVRSLNSLGVLEFERNVFDAARKHWNEALSEAEAMGAVALQAMLLNNLGEVATKEGRLADARKKLVAGLRLARDASEPRTEADLLRNLCLLELQQGELEHARSYGETCLELAQTVGLTELVGKAHVALAEIAASTVYDTSRSEDTRLTHVASAETHLRNAIQIFEELGSETDLARSLRRLGEFLVEQGRIDDALPLLEQALEIFHRIQLPEAETIEAFLNDLRP